MAYRALPSRPSDEWSLPEDPATPLLDSGQYDRLEVIRECAYCGNRNSDTIGRFCDPNTYWDFLVWCRGCGRRLEESTLEDLERLIEQTLEDRGDSGLSE
jgi:hypothetical protein